MRDIVGPDPQTLDASVTWSGFFPFPCSQRDVLHCPPPFSSCGFGAIMLGIRSTIRAATRVTRLPTRHASWSARPPTANLVPIVIEQTVCLSLQYMRPLVLMVVFREEESALMTSSPGYSESGSSCSTVL